MPAGLVQERQHLLRIRKEVDKKGVFHIPIWHRWEYFYVVYLPIVLISSINKIPPLAWGIIKRRTNRPFSR